MRLFAQHRDAGQIQRVARRRLISADAAFAQDDLVIAACHDVLSAHQPLLNRVRQPALEQNRLMRLAQHLQQLEILHVARANLNNVHIVEQRQMRGIHNFRHNGQSRCFLRFQQQLQTVLMQPLKRIRAGARLKRAAAQERCARRFDRLGNRDHLLFALHGARAGDNLEQAVPDGHAAAIHHRILRMELTVCFLVGFLNAADSLHCIQRGNEVGVHARRVAHQPQNGAVFAFRFVDAQPHAKEKLFQSVNLFLPCFVLQDDNHGVSSILPDIIVHYNLILIRF